MKIWRKFSVTILFFLFLTCGMTFVQAGEIEVSEYFTLLDENNDQVTMAGRELDVGDHYISADNKLYEVVNVENNNVHVKYLETVKLPDITEDLLTTQVGKTQESQGVVGIYHTHNAESYVPTSGTDSKEDGNGDVLKVGKILADAMKKFGLEVHWSDNSHLPHDGQAYIRSRRTAIELLKNNPDTLIDVHRDATPPEVYDTEIEGTQATKVRIVVGRQNQNRWANLEYAKRIKAVADKFYPGIIEGIFDARGNYNQDLGPKMILLEFGAHTNRLEQAEAAAEFFAKVIPAAAGLTPTTKQAAQKQMGRGAQKSIFWMILVLVAVVVIFLLISQGKIGSLRGFLRREAGLSNNRDDESDSKE